MEKILEVKNLSKIYKNQRGIKNLSFEIYAGDVFGFLGPNGAGKTTAMKAITGLCIADEGEVRISGYDLKNQFAKAMQKVGCLIETPDAYTYMTAYKNLQLSARFYPYLGKTRIDEVLELVGLSKYKNEKPSSYSLGMKQRLGLANAILAQPELVFLDEPSNGLDVEGMIDIRNTITRLAQEEQTTFFISSHLIHEIELVCNRIGIINNGKLIQEGLVTELLQGENNSIEEYYVQQIRADQGRNDA